MKALVLAGCTALLMMGLAPTEAKAEHDRRSQRGGRYHVDVHVSHGGYYGGPVICDPPRPVYRPVYHAPVYHAPPAYCPPPVRYCPPPVVYHRPVYHQPVYRSHHTSHYRGGYSRSCDW